MQRNSLRTAFIGVLILLGAIGPRVAAQTIWRTAASFSIDNVGDIDLDGVTDQIVSLGSGVQSSGAYAVIRGTDGGVIRAHTGSPGDLLGGVVAGIGDVDLDGIPDYLAAGTQIATNTPGAHGYGIVHSGLTGSLMRNLPALPGTFQAGTGVRGLGDVTGDGVPDYAMMQTFTAMNWQIYDGASGQALHLLPATFSQVYQIGSALEGIGDLDHDGVRDLAVGDIDAPSPAGLAQAGAVRLYSGATGLLFASVYGTSAGEHFGSTIARVNDADGDGTDDFAVGAPWTYTPALYYCGSLRVISGATLTPIMYRYGSLVGEQLGTFLTNTADFDGDGVTDIQVGHWTYNMTNFTNVGTVRVYSSRTGEIIGAAVSPAGTNALILEMASNRVVYPPDLDGVPGVDVVAIDGLGAFAARLNPALGTHAGAGNAGTRFGGPPEDVLKINGLTGGPTRRQRVALNSPFTLSLATPSTASGPAPFILFGMFGIPDWTRRTTLPSFVGDMAFPPTVLAPGVPDYFCLADSFYAAFLNPAIPFASPTPWSYAVPAGLPSTVALTLQAVILESPNWVSVSNAVVIDVR